MFGTCRGKQDSGLDQNNTCTCSTVSNNQRAKQGKESETRETREGKGNKGERNKGKIKAMKLLTEARPSHGVLWVVAPHQKLGRRNDHLRRNHATMYNTTSIQVYIITTLKQGLTL